MEGADFVSEQRVRGRQVAEIATVAGRRVERGAPIPWHHLALVPPTAARVHEAVGRLLRALAVALWAAPLLVVAKLITWALDLAIGDWLTVGFVCLVVALFATMAVWSVTFLVAGSRAERDAKSGLAIDVARPDQLDEVRRLLPVSLPLSPAKTLQAWADGEQPPAGLCVRGAVDAGGDVAPGEPVYVETWRDEDGALVREVEGRSFVVRVEGAPPIVVRLDGVPIVVAPSRALVGGDAAPPPTILHQGDEVELIATGVRLVPRLEDYRLGDRSPAFVPSGDYRQEATAALEVTAAPPSHLLLASAAKGTDR